MTKKKRSLKAIKGINKWEKLKQLASHHSKFLEHGLKQDGIENIHYLHMKHHLIDMDIQNNLNTKTLQSPHQIDVAINEKKTHC